MLGAFGATLAGRATRDGVKAPALEQLANATKVTWEIRYVLLLWLGLLCLLPFDLENFDGDRVGFDNKRTALQIRTVGLEYLGDPGVTRDAAALVLARLLLRYVLQA